VLRTVVSIHRPITTIQLQSRRTRSSAATELIGSQSDGRSTWALFSSEKFWEIDTVALSFVFDKYCPIMV